MLLGLNSADEIIFVDCCVVLCVYQSCDLLQVLAMLYYYDLSALRLWRSRPLQYYNSVFTLPSVNGVLNFFSSDQFLIGFCSGLRTLSVVMIVLSFFQALSDENSFHPVRSFAGVVVFVVVDICKRSLQSPIHLLRTFSFVPMPSSTDSM